MCISDIRSPLVVFLCLMIRVAKWLMPRDIRVEVRISTIPRAKPSSALGLFLSVSGQSVKLSATRGLALKRSLSIGRKSRITGVGSSSMETTPEAISPPQTVVSSFPERSGTPSTPSDRGRGLAI